MAEYRVQKQSYLHLPIHGGIRLHVDDPRMHQVFWHLSDPLIVVEKDQTFTQVTFDWDMKMSLADNICCFTSQQVIEQTPAATLKNALQDYLDCCKKPTETRARFKRVITLDMWLSDGRITHNYEDVSCLIVELDRDGLAENTLLYLPGWHAPYDKGYPAYAPAEELGGLSAFSRMFDTAEKCGLTIMLHLNVWGYDATLNLLPNFESIQLHDAQGHPMGWPGVTRTGSTHPLAYMKIQDERWQKLFMQNLEPLLEKYPIDALFLDQMGTYHGIDPDFDAALENMLQTIRHIKPNILLGGEHPLRHLAGQVDMFQIWGLPWCGLLEDLTDAASPIVGLLYAGQSQLIAHLGLPSFVPCKYTWTNFPYIVEHGIEYAARLAQDHARTVGELAHVRLNYREYGLDPLSLAVLQSS